MSMQKNMKPLELVKQELRNGSDRVKAAIQLAGNEVTAEELLKLLQDLSSPSALNRAILDELHPQPSQVTDLRRPLLLLLAGLLGCLLLVGVGKYFFCSSPHSSRVEVAQLEVVHAPVKSSSDSVNLPSAGESQHWSIASNAISNDPVKALRLATHTSKRPLVRSSLLMIRPSPQNRIYSLTKSQKSVRRLPGASQTSLELRSVAAVSRPNSVEPNMPTLTAAIALTPVREGDARLLDGAGKSERSSISSVSPMVLSAPPPAQLAPISGPLGALQLADGALDITTNRPQDSEHSYLPIYKQQWFLGILGGALALGVAAAAGTMASKNVVGSSDSSFAPAPAQSADIVKPNKILTF